MTENSEPFGGAADCSAGYWYTEIDYHHPYDAPDPESVSIMAWFWPYGLRASNQGPIDV